MYRKLTQQGVIYCLLILPVSLFAQSPGGVGRQSLWLKGNFFSDSTQTVTLNFNPAMDMNSIGEPIKIPGNIGDLRRATIFTVYQTKGSYQNTHVWQMNGGFGDLSLSAAQLSSKSEKMKMVFALPGTGTAQPQKPSAFISTYIRQQSTLLNQDGENNDISIRLGGPSASVATTNSAGSVAEFVVYETILKEKDIARVESYLAIKYGITLQKNYVNSAGETVWNTKKEKVYSNNIAGIGRDDKASLLQKQGRSFSSPEQLVIGIDKIAASNAVNTGYLNDKNYLIWGDNAKDFVFDKKEESGLQDIRLSVKKWMIKLSGNTTGSISTEMKIDTKTLIPSGIPPEYFCLAIDRSGSGDFNPENCTYVTPDSISADGIACFSGIKWDTDGSGIDVFSFGLKTRVTDDSPGGAKLVSFHVYPNPATDGNYNIAVRLDKTADIKIQVYDVHLRLVDSKKASGQADYLLPGRINAASGVYIIKLFTAGKEFSQLVIRP